MKPIVTAAIAETIVITYRDIKNGSNKDNPIPHLPIPSQYTSVVLIYGALAFAPEAAANLAGMIGWGFVVATILNLWTPGGGVKLATANAGVATSSPPPATVSPSTLIHTKAA